MHFFLDFMMKISFLICFFIMSSVATESDQKQWTNFKKNFNRDYKSIAEDKTRFEIFRENLRLIKDYNDKFVSGEVLFRLGINNFADRTEKEVVTGLRSDFEQPFERSLFLPVANNSLVPDSMDWRAKGAVSPVRNQKLCGGCWAFSAASTIASHLFIKNGSMIQFSVQNLIDCADHTFGYKNDGCGGGIMSEAFKYAVKYGVVTEREYPYDGVDRVCRQRSKGLKVRGYLRIPKFNEEAMKQVVGLIGPISVGIDSRYFLKFYRDGIFDSPKLCYNQKKINHAAVIVGYGTENNTDYWIVQNSWGTLWGEDGYFRVKRNLNMCGIATLASFPLIN